VTRVVRATFTIMALLVSSLAWGAEADSFVCSGDDRGGVCWLANPRLTDTATWRFTNVPAGRVLPLVLEGIANEICKTCQVGRDVLVRLYYQSPGDRYWQRAEFWLRNVAPNGADCLIAYPVRGETRIFPTGSELVIMAQRVLECDPHVGFSRGSLTFPVAPVAAPAPLPPLPTPPPPPPPPMPPAPPPPAPPEVCLVEADFSCSPASVAEGCAPAGVDLETVSRTLLPESFGPGEDAVRLPPGHYQGTLMADDYQDWYRFRVEFTAGMVVYVKTFGDLVVDVYLVHDPCGTDLAVCRDVRGATSLVAPCYPELQCETIPNQGEGVCFSGGACTLFVRIVRTRGQGSYFLSLLPAALLPR